MDRQNFDTQSVNNYPLTIDRMAEAQNDWQSPMKVLAGLLPSGNCILAGCESKGAAGWVRMLNENSQPEIFEVRNGSSSAQFLKLMTNNITAENSDGTTVTVRVERYLSWVANGSGTYVAYSDLPRLWAKVSPKNDSEWTACEGGTWWHVPTNGTSMRVKREGGRVHLWGNVKYGLLISGAVHYTGSWQDLTLENNITKTLRTGTFTLPTGYRPSGDMIIPIRYNGAVGYAILDSDGQILLTQDGELGDTLEINTWLDV